MRLALALALLGAGCASYSDTLSRGQRYYEDNQYERALALWRDLDRREPSWSLAERTRFAYFRGMTDYRLGFRDDARHWLAVARALHAEAQGLEPAWLARLDGALADLDRAASLPGGNTDLVQTIEVPAPAPRAPGPAGAAGDAASGEPAPAEPGEAPGQSEAPETPETSAP